MFKSSPKSQSGYTLIVVAALLVAFAGVTAVTLRDKASTQEVHSAKGTYEKMVIVRDAIERYFKESGDYPCPAPMAIAADDAAFNFGTSSDCSVASPTGLSDLGDDVWLGAVPASTLGISREYAIDEWGNKIAYAIHKDLIDADYSVDVLDVNGNSLGKKAYVLVSYGKDAMGAYPAKDISLVASCTAGGTLREENCDGDTTFVDVPQLTAASADVSEYYDDVVLYTDPKGEYHYGFGDRSGGQLFDGNATNTPANIIGETKLFSPGTHITQVYAGGDNACGIGKDGVSYCWGDNSYDAVGCDTTCDSNYEIGATEDYAAPQTVDTAQRIEVFDASSRYSCGISSSGAPYSGPLYCWGTRDYGISTRLANSAAASVEVDPLAASGGHDYSTLALSNYGGCAVRTSDRAAFCWGTDSRGQLGDGGGTTPNVDNPTQVSGTVKFFELAYASSDGVGNGTVCGIDHEGKIHCWGRNSDGGLGDNDSTYTNYVDAPQEVTSVANSYVSITAGNNFFCAIRTNGTVDCWGAGANGQIGNGASAQADLPTASNMTNATFISAGSTRATGNYGRFVCATNTSQDAYCWGNNDEGQFGLGTSGSDYNTPQQMDVDDEIAYVESGGDFTLAIPTGKGADCSSASFDYGSCRYTPLATSGAGDETITYAYDDSGSMVGRAKIRCNNGDWEVLDNTCAASTSSSCNVWGPIVNLTSEAAMVDCNAFRSSAGDCTAGEGDDVTTNPSTKGSTIHCVDSITGSGTCTVWGRQPDTSGCGSANCTDSSWTDVTSAFGGSIDYGSYVGGYSDEDAECVAKCSAEGYDDSEVYLEPCSSGSCGVACCCRSTASTCSSASLSWGGGCSATFPTTGDGITTSSVSNTASGYSGSATATCSGGSWNTPIGSCSGVSSCATSTLSWGAGCSASFASITSGSVSPSTANTAGGYTGSATASCSGTTWSTPSGTCAASGSCTASSGSVKYWDNAASGCYGYIPTSMSDGSSSTIGNLNGYLDGQMNVSCSSGTYVYGSNYCNCFIADTMITMADGSTKAIQELAVGDVVKGHTGNNTVITIREIPVESRTSYGFNGEKPFVTGGHPFYTKDGWKAVDPAMTGEEGHDVITGKLEVGDEILREDGSYMLIDSIGSEVIENTHVYNPSVDGDDTYYADGYLVHNK